MLNHANDGGLCASMVRAVGCGLLPLAMAVQAVEPPDAGQLLRQSREATTLPAPSSVPPTELPAAPVAAPLADEPSFTLRAVRFNGNQAMSTQELQALLTDRIGRPVGYAGIRELADRITAHYRAAGYPLALAVVPAQDIVDGTVSMEILEGLYGEVRLQNASGVQDEVLHRVLGEEVQTGRPIRQQPLDSALLRASDIPGAITRATFTSGSARGTADLQVESKAMSAFGGQLRADNAGNPYTGEERLLANLHWNNPSGGGDQVNLAAVTAGDGLASASLGYQLPVWFAAHRFGAQANWLDYELGETFKPLDSNGETRDGQLWWQWLAVRSRTWNLSTTLSVQQREVEDRLGALGVSEPKTTQTLQAGFALDNRDAGRAWIGRVALTLTAGDLELEDPAASGIDQLSAQSAGAFGKAHLSAVHHWQFGARLRWLNELEVQQAADNLDSSEKMSLGGPTAVRAYPVGEASGDNVVLLRSNLVAPLPLGTEAGAWEARLFVDAGHVELNESPWAGYSGGNYRDLAGGGVALHWQWSGLSALLTAARRIGNEPAFAWQDDRTQYWVELGWSF